MEAVSLRDRPEELGGTFKSEPSAAKQINLEAFAHPPLRCRTELCGVVAAIWAVTECVFELRKSLPNTVPP